MSKQESYNDGAEFREELMPIIKTLGYIVIWIVLTILEAKLFGSWTWLISPITLIILFVIRFRHFFAGFFGIKYDNLNKDNEN
ncbi:MAG: hypothetical protein IK041_06075 [Bacteroidales bacterium]|nr:hypothetical protein [Bacteroidales bacterium]